MADATWDVERVSASPGRGVQPKPLSTIDLIGITVGIVIGAGIFETPALVASHAVSTTGVILVWVLGGIVSLIGALCYAELASTYPNRSGTYLFLQRAFGGKVAFLFAWARLAVIQTGSIALLGFVFGDYATQIAPLGPYSASVYAAMAIVALTAVNIVGLEVGSRTQNILTLVEFSGMIAIVVAGLSAPPASTTATGAAQHPSIAMMFIFVLLTYGGWSETAFVSSEVPEPERSIPRALVTSIAIVTAVYVAVNFAFVHALGLSGLAASRSPAADLLRRIAGDHAAVVISVIVMFSALSSMNPTILTGARTNFALGRDFSLFRWLGGWNERAIAPRRALVLQGVLSLALVLLGTLARDGFRTMVEYTAPVFWFFFLLAGVSLFILRRKDAHLARPFRVPGYPATPLIFCATSAYLLYASVTYTGIGAAFGVAVLIVGAVVMTFSRPVAEGSRLEESLEEAA
jgi:amino acid transporter